MYSLVYCIVNIVYLFSTPGGGMFHISIATETADVPCINPNQGWHLNLLTTLAFLEENRWGDNKKS